MVIMTAVNRRTLAKSAAWASPVILATASVPAYAASVAPQPTYVYEDGLYVSATNNANQNMAGYLTTGPIATNKPTTPAAYFAANPKPENDMYWDDATDRPTVASYFTNGEGEFPPVTNYSDSGAGRYVSTSGYWFSAPVARESAETGTGYVGSSTLARGAVFETVVTLVVPAGGNTTITLADGTGMPAVAWTKALGPYNLNSSTGASVLSGTMRAAGTLTASEPTITTQADGSKVFRGVLTYTTTQDITTKGANYGHTQFMPARMAFVPSRWTSFTMESSVKAATLVFAGTPEPMDPVAVSANLQTVTIHP